MAPHSISDRQLALAIDIGGTRIKAGLINRAGDLLRVTNVATPAQAAPEYVVQQILAVARDLCSDVTGGLARVDGVGISIAGFVTADGKVTATAHLSHDWIGYDLKSRLRRDWDVAYYFALDTPAPTLGEAYYGAGKGIENFVYITVSTGIGAGIIAHGQYFTGGLGWAGGIGHIIIDETSDRICEGCGNAGCLETFAAKQGILTTARELLQRYPHSRMAALVDGQASRLTPQLVYDAAQDGDLAAQEVFRRAGHALGLGLTNLVDIVAPDRVVVGGGIAQAGDWLLGPARAVVRERAFPPKLRQAEIVPAALGDLSGVFGAAAMVFYDLRINPGE